jgi:hypothetical protein
VHANDHLVHGVQRRIRRLDHEADPGVEFGEVGLSHDAGDLDDLVR